jgi:hypothetical protein
VVERILTVGAIVLTVVTPFASMYPPSPLAPLFHDPDSKAQANSVLYFAIVGVVSGILYTAIAVFIYRTVTRSITARNLASGHEFDEEQLRKDRRRSGSPRDRARAVTIPRHEFEQEVASLLRAVYP